MADLKRALEVEGEVARSLLANINAVLADDEEATLHAIEGETNLIEAITSAVERVQDLEAMADATKSRLDDLKARRDRFDRQAENIRTALVAALGAVEMRKLELPVATLTIKAVPPKAVINSDADIPAKYWKPQDPKLDLKAITDALKAKELVPGASLSNGGSTLQVRFK